MLAATASPLVGAAGLLLIGLYAAPIPPIAFSLVACATPGRVSQAIDTVRAAFYLAFLVGPLLAGLLTEAFSILSHRRLR